MAKRRPCTKCKRNRDERFYVSARGRVCSDCRKGRVRLASRAVRLQETYGITEAEYQAIVDAQGGVCAICKGKRSYNYDLDHDHALERAGVPIRQTIRGACCRNCNRRVLRSARDNPALLRAAADYLENPPAQRVLSALTDQS